MKNIKVSIKLSKGMLDDLKELSKNNNTSMSTMVRTLLSEGIVNYNNCVYLDDWEPKEPPIPHP
jgi:hypothetical protein